MTLLRYGLIGSGRAVFSNMRSNNLHITETGS